MGILLHILWQICVIHLCESVDDLITADLVEISLCVFENRENVRGREFPLSGRECPNWDILSRSTNCWKFSLGTFSPALKKAHRFSNHRGKQCLL